MFIADRDPGRIVTGLCFLTADHEAGRAWGSTLGGTVCGPFLDDVLSEGR